MSAASLVQSAFSVLAGHWEAATYTPLSGSPKTIQILPMRGLLATAQTDNAMGLAYELSFFASAADITGVNVNGDTIAFKKRATDSAATTFTISTIIDSDAGMYHLGCN